MLDRGAAAGLALAVTDVLPWNNGDKRSAAAIQELNELIRELANATGSTLLRFHDTLADPFDARRIRAGLTDDGDHPSIEGHRLLGERAFRLGPDVGQTSSSRPS
jgi:lysophospholipase L1-like esterase